jgi:hypothetical protein
MKFPPTQWSMRLVDQPAAWPETSQHALLKLGGVVALLVAWAVATLEEARRVQKPTMSELPSVLQKEFQRM